ncbi:WD-40 repeat protein [Cardiosporidium cionae]|uniref:WD-40 repeat protein n=1 Tax=Cardiosporidium cionae TaxID=476202 RepID=A0ABQ7J8N0_9APIC|nr:WD-40 repeat protein [Cardiosporidium cionae]|eukprot:KAF8820348.1 WD-40 repeat protein [Cardiosporidium cionae]
MSNSAGVFVSTSPSLSELESFLFGESSSRNSGRHSKKTILKTKHKRIHSSQLSKKKAGKQVVSASSAVQCDSPSPIGQKLSKSTKDDSSNEPAWFDEDDSNLMVDVVANKKLNKLRLNANERILSSSTYQKRLRAIHTKLQQSHALVSHASFTECIGNSENGELPTPSWVELAKQRKKSCELSNGSIAGRMSLQEQGLAAPLSEDEESADGGFALSTDTYEGTYNKVTGQNTLLAQSNSVVFSKSLRNDKILSSDTISVKTLSDIHKNISSSGAVNSVQFHSNSSLIFSTSSDKSLRLFQVDGVDNRQLESIYFQQFPIHEAKFTNDYQRIFMLSNRKSLAEYDLQSTKLHCIPTLAGRSDDQCYRHLTMGPCVSDAPGLNTNSLFAVSTDRNGYVLLCDCKTKHMVKSFKMNADAAAISFHSSRNHLITADSDAYNPYINLVKILHSLFLQIYEWDVGTGRCIQRYYDSNSLKISCMATTNVSQPQLLATGSTTGFLNIYPLRETVAYNDLLKSFGNLATSVTSLDFHPSSDVLCYASKWKPNAVRLVHIPSMTVYSNWPLPSLSLQRTTVVNFSRKYGYLAVGNENGRVHLFQLEHFS